MLYIIGGENIYQSEDRLEELKSEFKERYKEGSIQIFNADEIENPNEILHDADSYSLFHKDKLIVIKRLFSTQKEFIDKISSYVQESKICNLIFWEDKKIDKRRSLYKYVKKKGVVEEFTKLKYSQIKSWLIRKFKPQKEVDSQAVDLLMMKVGDDQRQLEYTADNLIALADERGLETISIDEIEDLVEKTSEDSIWDLMDALSNGDKAKSLKLVEDILRERQDFIYIIAMLARQFRILSLVKYLSNKGKRSSEITRILKLHPFVVKKTLTFIDNFTFDKLRKLYRKLVKTDLVVKEGKFESKLALDLLIAAI